MITVKGEVANAYEAAFACYQAKTTALQGWGKVWDCPGNEAMTAVKYIKLEIDKLERRYGEAPSLLQLY